jgi:hypothetical protein
MTLRNHFVVKTGCNEESWFATKWFHFGSLSGPSLGFHRIPRIDLPRGFLLRF